jgi:glyoxylate/hydroxypyruvate reductase
MATGEPAGILIASGPWDPEPWAAAVRAIDPARPVAIWPDIGSPESVRYLFAWNPPPEALRDLPNLRAIFYLGAGVDRLFLIEAIPDVPIVRVVDPDLTRRMTEWVVLQVLIHHRRALTYLDQQRRGVWNELSQPAAGCVGVGIMGMGVLGRDVAEVLVRLGFDVAGWSRRPAMVPRVANYAGRNELDAFLGRTDILVSLLPLTPETHGILSMRLFRKLRRSGPFGAPVLINAGRGGLHVEADIVAALGQGVLGGASLDVFEHEPLDPSSPLWSMRNVVVTPHSAGWSDPAELTKAIMRQIVDFEAGAPLRNLVDRTAQY